MAKILLTIMALMEKGSVSVKLLTAFTVTLAVSPFAYFIDVVHKRVFNDHGILEVLVICIIADLITGIWKHLKQHTFDWKRLYTGLIEKVGISMIGMIIFNSIGSIEELSKLAGFKEWLVLVGKLTNVLYVGGSALNNLYVVSGGQFPPVGWMKRMKAFNSDLDLKELTKGSEDMNTNNQNNTTDGTA